MGSSRSFDFELIEAQEDVSLVTSSEGQYRAMETRTEVAADILHRAMAQ